MVNENINSGWFYPRAILHKQIIAIAWCILKHWNNFLSVFPHPWGRCYYAMMTGSIQPSVPPSPLVSLNTTVTNLHNFYPCRAFDLQHKIIGDPSLLDPDSESAFLNSLFKNSGWKCIRSSIPAPIWTDECYCTMMAYLKTDLQPLLCCQVASHLMPFSISITCT